MAIQGKKAYKLYLSEQDYEFVKRFVDASPSAGGMSALFDEFLSGVALSLRSSGVKGKPMSFAKVIRVFLEGVKRM